MVGGNLNRDCIAETGCIRIRGCGQMGQGMGLRREGHTPSGDMDHRSLCEYHCRSFDSAYWSHEIAIDVRRPLGCQSVFITQVARPSVEVSKVLVEPTTVHDSQSACIGHESACKVVKVLVTFNKSITALWNRFARRINTICISLSCINCADFTSIMNNFFKLSAVSRLT
jgi:hypothetical protein